MIQAKRRFGFRQGLAITVNAVRSIPRLKAAKKRLGADFMERLMLTVTEVNGCAACAWGHSKAALEAGLSQSEIAELLAGDTGAVPERQATAVAFAQHYADTTGSPSPNTWGKLQAVYGEQGAQDILAMIRMIMWGNAYGIPLSAIIARFRGHPEPGSSPLYEVAMCLSVFPKLPLAMLLARLRPDPLVDFVD